MPLLHHETIALSLAALIVLGLPLAAAACARIVSRMRNRNSSRRRPADNSHRPRS